MNATRVSGRIAFKCAANSLPFIFGMIMSLKSK